MIEHQAAAVARLKSTAGHERVYSPNKVPVSPKTPYYVVTCDSGAPGAYRQGGRTTTARHTVAVQAMGTSYTEVGGALELADEAFEMHELDVPGFDVTVARRAIATNPNRDPDGGSLLVGLHAYQLSSSRIPSTTT